MDDVDVRIPALSRRQLFGGAAAAVVLLLLVVRHIGGGAAAPPVTPVQPAAKPKAAAPKLLVIDVAGAVRRPGLYRLRSGSRIDDAIAAAGGTTHRAQLDTVNLAAPVADGEQVVVPRRGAVGGDAASPPAAGSSPAAPLDLNVVTFEQLRSQNLSVTQATRLLAHRERLGGFRSVDDLDQVPGFPDDLLADLKSRSSV